MNNTQMNQTVKFTNRELKVIKLVCEEYNNSEIGKKLYLSTNSIKLCLEKLYRKLKIRNRVELAVYAIKHGLF